MTAGGGEEYDKGRKTACLAMDSSRRTEKRVKEHMRDGKRRDQVLLLAAGFFYFSSPMAVTPIITRFSGSLGASAALMGLIGGLMNLCSLC